VLAGFEWGCHDKFIKKLKAPQLIIRLEEAHGSEVSVKTAEA